MAVEIQIGRVTYLTDDKGAFVAGIGGTQKNPDETFVSSEKLKQHEEIYGKLQKGQLVQLEIEEGEVKEIKLLQS